MLAGDRELAMQNAGSPDLARLRRATALGWAAAGCYAAVLAALVLILVWPESGWLAIGLAVLGFALQRAAAFQRRAAEREAPGGPA
jgi:hypothetical protein